MQEPQFIYIVISASQKCDSKFYYQFDTFTNTETLVKFVKKLCYDTEFRAISLTNFLRDLNCFMPYSLELTLFNKKLLISKYKIQNQISKDELIRKYISSYQTETYTRN